MGRGGEEGGSDPPLTRAVTCSLPVPRRFLTSQMKVVLTASSTFSTVSLFSLRTTVSGISPVRLQWHKGTGIKRGAREGTVAEGDAAELLNFTTRRESLCLLAAGDVRGPCVCTCVRGFQVERRI